MSFPPPPSPVAIQSLPSGPNAAVPPFWFPASRWGMVITVRCELSRARRGLSSRLELGDLDVAAAGRLVAFLVGVVDVEAASLCKVGRNAVEEALLAPERDEVREVDQRLLKLDAVLDYSNLAALLCDVDEVGKPGAPVTWTGVSNAPPKGFAVTVGMSPASPAGATVRAAANAAAASVPASPARMRLLPFKYAFTVAPTLRGPVSWRRGSSFSGTKRKRARRATPRRSGRAGPRRTMRSREPGARRPGC